MLQVEDVRLDYDGVQALDGISLEVPAEKITTVVGSNGAGKTSLMNAILGLAPVSGGKIFLDDMRLDGLPTHAVVQLGIALVPEGRELFPRMSVLENLLVGGNFLKSSRERWSNVERVFQLFPVLRKKRDTNAGNLSGGEQQMLAFGRALMSSPRVLLLDEPSIGLAPLIEESLMETVRNVTSSLGVGVLLVEQNAMLALENSDTAYVMELGRIVRNGSSDELISDPSIAAAYLGG